MPNIGPVELIIILVIALLILGPGRLPDVGSALGKSIREFRKAATDVQDSVKLDATPAPSAPAPNTLGQAAAPNVLATPAAAAPEPPAASAAPVGETVAPEGQPDAELPPAEPEPVAASPEPRA